MPEGFFSVRELGETIAKILGLSEGSNIVIQRDRLNSDRIMIVKMTRSEKEGES